MAGVMEDVAAGPLSLPDELVLVLLNEQNGYFHQVPGWNLNCAIVGAVLAELSLRSRIDTDMESLHLVDATETGDPALDSILKEITEEPARRNAQYWVERLVLHAEPVIDLTLDRLLDMDILERHNGDFYTLAPAKFHAAGPGGKRKGTTGQLIKARIGETILTDLIPDPRDVIIIGLVNTCDVFRFMFDLDEEAERRIETICRMDLIGRSIADAVKHNIANPLLRRSTLNRKIPNVPLRRIMFNPHLRAGNIPALFAELTESYGPVFRICPPFREPLTFISGAKANQWVHRHGRMYLRARDYFADFEKIYGASGVLPSLDGTDHFRLRKALSPAYSRERLAGQMDQVLEYGRKFMADWTVGDTLPATRVCRRMINAQISPLFIGVESQDIFDDLIAFKERALNVHILRMLPGFMMGTPRMKRTAKAIDILLERIEGVHTPTQRIGCPRDLADDLLSLHASEPQLVPESNLRFALSAARGRERVYGRCVQLRGLRHGVAARPLPQNPGRSRRPVPRRRPGRRELQSVRDRHHPAFSHGMPQDVSDRPDVAQERDEQLCGGGLRTAGRDAGPHSPVGVPFHGRVLPGPLLIRHRPLPAGAQRTPPPRIRSLRARHAQMSGLAVDEPAVGRQSDHGRALLRPRNIPGELQAPVQPASVAEAEQGPEIPRGWPAAGIARPINGPPRRHEKPGLWRLARQEAV